VRLDEFFIPGAMPNMNRIVALRASTYRGAYSAEKRKWERVVAMCAAGISVWEEPAYILIDAREPNKRRDPDGVFSGCSKFILDGLVNCGVLQGDGWKHIRGLSFTFSLAEKGQEGVFVTLANEPIVRT
jgi:hypothetical protein